ncbi:unnamed protein product [Rotaria sp. Silwood1]|nr:unnamed protein product [Rotaria sp. Silwood1]CAF1315605.1 unnamed protein product [Rotaria sp. Silwood1]CAF3501034.1 unnamed protein product [Rotaria sp. Silwood1]CAF4730071.1 unnamed protein product [Rotaria sp. Silwood1]
MVAVSDINNDNNLDVIFVCPSKSIISTVDGYGNNSTFENQMKKISSSDFRLVSIAIGDFSDDNKVDFAVGNCGSGVSIFFGYNNGTFAYQTTYSTRANSHPNSIAVDDFNNDNQLDIVVTNEDVNSIGLLLGYGNENFANQTILLNQSDFQPFSITIADIDHDHCLDIIVANHKNESISVIFGDGNDKVKSIIQYSIGYSSRPYSIVLYDFNNDTHIDIAVTDDATNTINILFGYGNIQDIILNHYLLSLEISIMTYY